MINKSIPTKVEIEGVVPLTEWFACDIKNWIGSSLSTTYVKEDCDLEAARPFPMWVYYYEIFAAFIQSFIWCAFFFQETILSLISSKRSENLGRFLVELTSTRNKPETNTSTTEREKSSSI